MTEPRKTDLRFWFASALCGVVILFLLAGHMTTVFLDDVTSYVTGAEAAPLSWAEVSARGQSMAQTVAYVILLGTALFHGLYGLNTILTEFWSGPRAVRLISIGCWVAGIILFVLGAAGTIVFYLQLQEIP